MREKLTWVAYSNRRGLSLESLYEKKGFNSYEELTAYLADLWVSPPEKDSQEWLDMDQKITSSTKNAFIEKVKKTGIHPDGKPLKKGEDPESVWDIWESAVASSYGTAQQATAEINQEAPEKAPSTRKSSTRKTSTRKSTARKTTTRKAKTSTRKTAPKKGN